MNNQTETPRACIHGRLARSCNECFLERELNEAKAEIEAHKQTCRVISKLHDDAEIELNEQVQIKERSQEDVFKLQSQLTQSQADCAALKAQLNAAADCYDTLKAYEIIAELRVKLTEIESERDSLLARMDKCGYPEMLAKQNELKAKLTAWTCCPICGTKRAQTKGLE
jgi:hypothetical protein